MYVQYLARRIKMNEQYSKSMRSYIYIYMKSVLLLLHVRISYIFSFGIGTILLWNRT